MDKKQFLDTLMSYLTDLSDADRRYIADYYGELICDGMENGRSEAETIEGFGAPEEIAAQIRAEYSSQPQPRAPYVPHVPNEYAARQPVQTVVLEASNVRVQVRSTSTSRVRVLFTPRECDHVTLDERDGVFRFNHRMDVFPWKLMDLFRSPGDITLELPTDFQGEINVRTSNSSITAFRLMGLSCAQFTTSNARVLVESSQVGMLTLKTTNGSLEARDCTGGTLQAGTSNGRVTAENCSFPAELNLHTSNGAVRIQRVESENYTFKTTNGTISGTVVGDMREYAIQSHTSNGQNNLPGNWVYPGQTKRLSANTSNGRIDVKFLP